MTTARPILLRLLVASLVLYHAVNFLNPSWYHMPYDWLPQPVTLGWLGGTVKLGTVVIEGDRRRHRTTDFSSYWLASQGGALRFSMGQFRPDIRIDRGHNPWRLYLREEALLQTKPPDGLIREIFLDPIAEFRRYLDGRVAGLIVLPIPTKISVERERLAELPYAYLSSLSRPTPEDGRVGYATLAGGHPADTIDLQRIFVDYLGLHPGDDLYLPYDSHWTSLGMAVTAKAVVDHWRTRGWDGPETMVTRSGEIPPAYTGDLLHALLLPRWLVTGMREFQWSEPIYTLTPLAPASPGAPRLVLLGSSFGVMKRAEPYAFGRLVAEALGRELVNESVADVQTWIILDGLRRSGFRLRRSDLVILEFPYRRQWPKGAKLAEFPID